MSERVKITIIGAGVIGCALAYQLSKKYSDIFVIDRNKKVTAENQSSRNAGVIHAGIYYPRDESPLKSKLCVEGNRLLYNFCQEFNVPHRQTGKLVLANENQEFDYLEDTFQVAIANGVPGAKIISPQEAKQMEPNIYCRKAAFFPTSGIIEATQLVYRLFTLASHQGSYFIMNTEVIDLKPEPDCFAITTRAAGQVDVFETEFLINSAGLYSDKVAKMINPGSPYEIVPIRGESAKFYKSRRQEIYHSGLNVYPVPHPLDHNGRTIDISIDKFKQLFKEKKVLKTVGAHLTPTFDLVAGRYEIGNTVTIGPATKGVFSKEDYTIDLYPPAYYLGLVNSFFPNLTIEDISLHQAGIQAKLRNQFDWVIEPEAKHPKCIQLIGIDSPGLTACLAIAKYVEELVSG